MPSFWQEKKVSIRIVRTFVDKAIKTNFILQKKIVFLRVVDLQGILASQNLNRYGKKDELQKRIVEIFRGSDSALKTKIQKKIEEILSNNNNSSKVWVLMKPSKHNCDSNFHYFVFRTPTPDMYHSSVGYGDAVRNPVVIIHIQSLFFIQELIMHFLT